MATRKPTVQPRSKASTSPKAARARLNKFIELYCGNNQNGTLAAKEAGFSPKTAASQASRLLKNVKVRAEIDKRMAEALALAQKKTNLTVEGVLRSLARAVLFDPRKLVDKDGKPVALKDLDDDTALAVDGVEFDIGKNGKASVAKYKTNRGLARDQALKHLGLFKEDNEQPAKAMAEAVVMSMASIDPLKARFVKMLAKGPTP